MATKEEKGRQGAIDGIAHGHIVFGLLMKKYRDVFHSDLPLSSYDIIIGKKRNDSEENTIRAQVKTSPQVVPFTGGGRSGVARRYKSGVKEYIYSTKTSDVVIGIRPIDDNSFELYFVPTVLIEELKQKSISIRRIQALKDNYFILENCKNRRLIIQKCKEYGIL